MTDYYIFRHGDTRESKSFITRFFGYGRDSHSIQILPQGIPALERIGRFLKDIPTDADFCSPYLRCMDSAKIVGGITGKKYQPDKRLSELESKGEKFPSFKSRVIDFLNEIDKKNYSAVSICTHGAVIAAIKHLETSGRFFFLQVLDFPNPGNLIVIKKGVVENINFNSK